MMTNLMPGHAHAVLFDLDGVVVESAPFHLKSWLAFARNHGLSMTEEEFWRTFGLRNEEILARLFGRSLSTEEQRLYAEEKEVLFRRAIRGRVRARPGAKALVQALYQEGYRLALVSSTPLANIELILGELQLTRFFHVILSGEDVSRGKPAPEGYLKAAERLGVEPSFCVVIEDAPAGIEAAKRAGMRALAVTGTQPREKLHQADLIVDSLEQVSVGTIQALLEAPSHSP